MPETQISQQNPGNLFEAGNIADLILHSDLNLQSVLQFSIEVLKTGHVIIFGHCERDGINAAIIDLKLELIDNRPRNIKELYQLHKEKIDSPEKETKKVNRLSELSVKQLMRYAFDSPFVRWNRLREEIYGWIYNLETGLIEYLEDTVRREE